MRLKNYCIPLQALVLSNVLLDWKNQLQEEFDLLSRFLYPTNELAITYPMNRWASYRVVIHPNGKIVGIDDNDYENRLDLTKQDIIMRQFDLKAYRREMCENFGLKPSPEEIGRLIHGVPWGTWEPERGTAFPVTLLFVGNDFRSRVFERVLKRKAKGEILITPTRQAWRDGLEELARENKVLLVPLDEIVQMEDGKLQPTPEWDEYLAAFCMMVEMDLPSRLLKSPRVNQFEFRRKGQVWMIRFDGKEGFLKDSVGVRHLSNLFSKPGESVFAVDLHLFGSGYDPQMVTVDTGIEVSDRQSIQEIEERSRTLLSELDQAQNEGNSILEDEIREEIDRLADYLCQVKGLGGRLRKGNDNADSIRRSVQQGIKRVLDSLDDDLPEFVKHCRQSISFGFVLRYDPATKIAWEL